MSEKHTPGPWRIRTTGNIGNCIEGQSGKKLFAGDDGFRSIATFQHCEQTGLYVNEQQNALANARLIARAPDLLADNARLRAALKRMLAIHGTEEYPADHRVTQARAALKERI